MVGWIPGILVILAATTSITSSSGGTNMLTAVTTTKPGCQRQCGNITIPYPFSIGLDGLCSIGQFYDVECNTTFNPPKPFLGQTNVEISEISESYIKLKNFVAKSCNNSLGWNAYSYIELPSFPFTFSDTRNTFYGIGCNVFAIIYGRQGKWASGCVSLCTSKEDVVGGTCSGIGCCQFTPIPKGLKGYDIQLQSVSNQTNMSSFDPCNYAFLGETGSFTFGGAADLSDTTFWNRTTDNVPVVLEWKLGNGTTCTQAQNLSTYACQQNTTCIDVDGGYHCNCTNGYEGNPYLSPGCTDIDKCAPAMVTATVAALSFAFICMSWIYFTIKKRELLKMREKFFEQNGGLLLKKQLASNQGGNESMKIFSAYELKSATNDYSEDHILGKGGYGTVYKGVLSDNRIVAIKKSKVSDESQIGQFINEVVILTQINHRNVVKLLGCCLETEVLLLVYEFVPNGTLFEHIHNKGGPSWLTWASCLRIASEAANALSYLHSAASIPIFHKDIKSANILIDDSYDAKIADFGASRLVPLDQTQVTTLVQGTLGYLDPEYFQTSQLTEKSDVYSFGVLLAELLTREKPICIERKMEERNLASYFVLAMKEDRVLEIVHVDLIKEANEEQLLFVAKLTKSCLSMSSEDRPTMMEVAMELEGLKKNINHPWAERSREESAGLAGDLYPVQETPQASMIVDSE